MINKSFSTPLARIMAGGAAVFSLVSFVAFWMTTVILTGFTISGDQVWTIWTYTPMFWPQLMVAVLGGMVAMRYGSNWITAILVIIGWIVAVLFTGIVTISYWRFGWLCNISGSGTLSGVIELDICANQNSLLIVLWVTSTFMWIATFVGAGASMFDVFQAGRAGKGGTKPSLILTGESIIIGLANVISLLCILGLMFANLITSASSFFGVQTYAIWAPINIFMVQIAATVMGLMMWMRYGTNWLTGMITVGLWSFTLFSDIYVGFMYWWLGYMCHFTSGTSLNQVETVVCKKEGDYLIAVWIFVTILWVTAVMAVIAHLVDYFTIKGMNKDTVIPFKISSGGTKTVDDAEDDAVYGEDSLFNAQQDQPATLNDERRFIGRRLPPGRHVRRALPKQARLKRAKGRV